MAIKAQKIYYIARNGLAGLSDVKANIYKDGSNTPVASNLTLTELDASGAPGVYVLSLTASNIVNFGGVGNYAVKIDSVSRPALATTKFEATLNSNDEIELHLVAMEQKLDAANAALSSIASELGQVKSLATSTNSVVIDPVVGNANIKALIENVISAVTSVQNNTSFVAVLPGQLVVPDAGSKTYKIPIRLFDSVGNAEDPDNMKIYVSCKNESGLDRTALIAGYVGGAVEAARSVEGVYEASVVIPHTAAFEQLVFEFAYTEGGKALNQVRTTETVPDAQATGYALQTTLLDVLADTSDVQPKVTTIFNMVQDATYGLPALKALIDIANGFGTDISAKLSDAVSGLPAIRALLETKASASAVAAIETAIQSDIKGAGFDPANDSLHAISQRTYSTGGSAI